MAKSRHSQRTPWNLFLEKFSEVVSGKRQIIFQSCLNRALILKYDVYHFKRLFYKSIKSQFVVKMVKPHFVFVKPLSEQCPSSCTIYATNSNVAVTLAQFLSLLQNEGNGLKEIFLKIITSGSQTVGRRSKMGSHDCSCFFVFILFSENVESGTNVSTTQTHFGVTQQKVRLR